MANSIEYIQNTSNISSITSLENNEKFITVKYLNNYNSILCKNIIDVVNATIMNSSNLGCLFINENENILSFHFQRDDITSIIFNVEEDNLLNKTIFLDKLKYFKLPANLHLIYTENFATFELDGTPDTLSISLNDGTIEGVDEWEASEFPLISITNVLHNYRLNIGNYGGEDINTLHIFYPIIKSATITSSFFTGILKGTISGIDAQGSSNSRCTLSRMSLDSTCLLNDALTPNLGYDEINSKVYNLKFRKRGTDDNWRETKTIRGGILTADDASAATKLYWSDNSDPSNPTTITLAGGGSSTSNFPGDIVIEFQENSYFDDRTTVMLIDHIGGLYKLEQNNGMQLLSYSNQQDYINDVGNFKEDLGNTSTPYYNAIIPIGLCYSKYDLNEPVGGVKNTWLPNYFYGINTDGNDLVPSWDITNINKMLLTPSIYGYPFEWTNIDFADTDKLSVPPGSIILLNVSTLPEGGGNRALSLPYTFIKLTRLSDYKSTREFLNARVYTNQFLDPRQNNNE